MIVKQRENREQVEIFSIEEFVPADHLLRKIDSAIDFTYIYEIVEDLYCADNGRPSIDPVVIFKMVLIQHLYGLPSLRRTVDGRNQRGQSRPRQKPFDGTKATEEKAINESTTDPESGVFHKGEHKKCFAYTAQTGCDKNGYVMDVTVNSGNVHDSVAFDGLYERLIEKNPEIEAVVMDAGYKTPWISKRVLDDKRIPVLPYKRPMGKQDFFKPYEYVYDKYYDCVICPENHVLNYATTNREEYREFKSKTYICENCPSRYKCTENSKYEKTVTKHIWSDYLEKVEDIRHTPIYKEMYERRKETIERVFADAKEKHAMRYTPYRGLSQVTNWVRLKFATMNLKKYAVHRWKRLNALQPSAKFSLLFNFLLYFNFKTLKLS